MSRLYLLPFQQLSISKEQTAFDQDNLSKNGFLFTTNKIFFDRAQDGIDYLAEKFNIKREDEVFISTTSDEQFVSSCVTCSLFNYAKVSRVLTEKTKLIWIIHEFGFPDQKIDELVAIGRARNIPIVEDSAHSMDSYYKDRLLGTIGDYGLYSLPKSLPVPNGGMLVSNKRYIENTVDYSINSIASKYFNENYSFIKAFSEARRKNFIHLSERFKNYENVYIMNSRENPFVFGFKTSLYEKVYAVLDVHNSGIELARSYVQDWVLLPINQYINSDELNNMADRVKNIIE